MDSLNDIFVVLGPDGDIQRVNERAVAVTGYPESELLAMDATTVFAPEDRDAVTAAISDAYETGEAEVEATLVTKDGERIQYEYRGRRLHDDEGNQRGLAVIGRDITGRVLNEQRLDVALRMLRHNLRNKLNVITGWAESFDGPGEESTAREQIVDSSGQK